MLAFALSSPPSTRHPVLPLRVSSYRFPSPRVDPHKGKPPRRLMHNCKQLAMQKRINLSIQLPDDDSSLLPVHADVWSGDSPFEVVIWVPLVNCYGTKTMFLLPPKPDKEVSEKLALFREQSAEELYNSIQTDLHWIEISYGEVLLFTQNLMHGNRINTESQTRWSLNCRFKSLFSPYAEKRLGDFFEPITIRPATRFGMTYRLPEGFA